MQSEMTPAVERLVRLMVLLPEYDHPLWSSLIDDYGDGGAAWVRSMRWFVGDSAVMWPPAGPVNLAQAVLTTFGVASENTLRLLSETISTGSGLGPEAGAAWVTQATAAAIEVFAQGPPLEAVLQEVKDHWTLSNG